MIDLRPKTDARATRGDVRELAAVLGTRIHVDVVVPRTDVRGKMRLCSRAEELEANAEARRAMIEAGYPVNAEAHTALGGTQQWLVEVAVRLIAVAVRDPADTERALAPLDSWRMCDDQQILALWTRYQDLTQELDPLGADSLTDQQLADIEAAAKKKDVDRLMGCGSRSLAIYAITSAAQLASSEIPKSMSGQSPS